jgi:pyridoxine 4-dehydrogenase
VPWAPLDYDLACNCLKKALEEGANLWNGVRSRSLLYLPFTKVEQGIHYGTPNANSLHLLRYYFEKYPGDAEKVVLSIKGALGPTREPTGSPEAIRASVEAAYQVLKDVKTIDVFEMARVDPEVPIETSLKALVELVAEGKIGGIGLSEVSAATIRRATAVHKIAAVEIELSLFTPDPLYNGIMDTCAERRHPFCPEHSRVRYADLVSQYSSGGVQPCWARSPHRHVSHALGHPSKRLSTQFCTLQARSIRAECEAR